jgi:hypothetical protein
MLLERQAGFYLESISQCEIGTVTSGMYETLTFRRCKFRTAK